MALLVRALQLRVETENGPFGATLSFDGGLSVLRAENSSGKSTCVQGILYALGLEGMLSASRDVPLAHAMTNAIFDPRLGHEVPVTESWVSVEVENGRGDVLTVRRYARHRTVSRDLVRVWRGAAISETPTSEPTDYFVRRPGAAQREMGFHYMLAQFIGWDLPRVPTFDEDLRPLYLETIFPLFIVEQKRGWAAIQAQVPTQYRIRDVRHRALEFVLRLESARISSEIETLERQAQLLRQEWRERRGELDFAVRAAGAVLQNLPSSPSDQWPPSPEPAIVVPQAEGTWLTLGSAIDAARATLDQLSALQIRTSSSSRQTTEAELGQIEDQLRKTTALAAQESDSLAAEEAHLGATDARLADLDVDLRRHQDLRTISQLGGAERPELLPDECPTCHQDLPPSVLDEVTAPRVMTVDETIGFIEAERQLFRDLQQEAQRIVEAKRARLSALAQRATDSRTRIVALRNTLISPDTVPSEADVERRVTLRAHIQRLAATSDDFQTHMTEFTQLASEWTANRARLRELRALDFGSLDEEKRSALQDALLEQLAAYGFSSVPVNSISISESTWLPSHEGFDLAFDLSASDMIRLIWAYLLSLLELDRSSELNHLKLLVFDEPRQQMASPESFAAFMRRASSCALFNQQVLVATSEPRHALDSMLENTPAQVIDFENRKILAPLSI